MARWERGALVAVCLLGALVAATVAPGLMWGFLYVLSPEGAEEETDWSTQGIEVIVTEADRTCAFNVEAVAPGRHDVHVVPNDADTVVTIRDPSGEVVMEQAEEASDDVSEATTVRLRLGTYDVECRTPSVTIEAQLPVVPAEDLG